MSTDSPNTGGDTSPETGSLFPDAQSTQEEEPRQAALPRPQSEPPGRLYTIGEVVSALRDDFPSLSVSKVRYLERRRLLNLERTSGGYRLFRQEDIRLLRRILTLQEREYLPLEVIKQRIDSGIIQTDEDADGLLHSGKKGGHSGSHRTVVPGGGRTYSREELCEELSADPRFVEELISVGVIGRRDTSGGGNRLDGRDLEICRMAIEMSKYSIQPRHLRGIVAAVDREVAMFKQVLSPELRSGDEQRIASAMESARNLASVDSRLKELIMSGSIESLDTR